MCPSVVVGVTSPITKRRFLTNVGSCASLVEWASLRLQSPESLNVGSCARVSCRAGNSDYSAAIPLNVGSCPSSVVVVVSVLPLQSSDPSNVGSCARFKSLLRLPRVDSSYVGSCAKSRPSRVTGPMTERRFLRCRLMHNVYRVIQHRVGGRGVLQIIHPLQ
jgi:hypothetical protein